MAGKDPASGNDYKGKQAQQLSSFNKSMQATYSKYMPASYQHFAADATNLRAAAGGGGGTDMGQSQQNGAGQSGGYQQYMQDYGNYSTYMAGNSGNSQSSGG